MVQKDAKERKAVVRRYREGIDARNHAYLTLERGRRGPREDEGSHHEEFRGSHVKLSNV